MAKVAWNLRPGVPDLSRFPQDEWLAAARRGARSLPWAELGYGDPRGLRPARAAVVAYAGRVRRVVATADHVLLCSGLAHGLALLARHLRSSGCGVIAVEDPSSFNQRLLLEANGLEVVGVPVDDGGIDVERLRATPARAVLVTPAHQFPTGVVLAPERRHALVDWARGVGGIVIEDDYDAEYRYDRAPIGSLQGLAPDCVVHGGSLSKSLAPALRLGWLVGPTDLIGAVADQRWTDDLASPALTDVTLAEFIRDGGLDRHLRRTRAEYRRRRDALVDAVAHRLPEARVLGAAAGLQVVVLLSPDADERAIVAAARARGIDLVGLEPYRLSAGQPGLVLGYAALAPGSLRRAVAALADVIDAAAPSRGGRRRSRPAAPRESGPAG